MRGYVQEIPYEDYSRMSDEELIQLVQDGDKNAEEIIIKDIEILF